MPTQITFKESINRALADELERDGRVFLIGEDIAVAGGVFKVTEGLLERFGPKRVRDTPIAEQAIIGCAIGAAVTGLRPIAELMFADFAAVCYDQIANQAAKYRYMTGGQASVPMTVRLSNGAGGGFGSQHQQTVENWFLNNAGIKICVPSTPRDMYGILKSAIRDDDPVLVFEHRLLYGLSGEIEEGEAGLIPLGKADVVRSGSDVTVVATQLMRHRVVEAAERLAGQVDVEVIDPRTLVPLDFETVVASLDKTARIVVVQESPAAGSWGASLVARVAEEAFELLDARPVLVSADDTPIPYSKLMEEAWMPSVERIAESIQACAEE